ncbi:MAG: transposase, partial [Bacillota bacterium]|nr:transposase [Bacillota bacterium]
KAKNLLARLEKLKDNHLLFLRNLAVAPTNNRAERLARCMKRKLRQSDGFRSEQNLEDYCIFTSYIENLRMESLEAEKREKEESENKSKEESKEENKDENKEENKQENKKEELNVYQHLIGVFKRRHMSEANSVKQPG